MTIRQVVFLSIGKGSAGPWHLEPIFVDFETLDFRIERSRGQPDFRGGAGWARDLSITFLSCGFDDFLLLPSGGTIKLLTRLRACPNARGTGNLEKFYQGELAYSIRLAKQRN